METLDSHKMEDHIPALSKWGTLAFELLRQARDFTKLHYPGQVVSDIDPADIRFRGDICSVIKDDYFAPQTCEGDYNKTLYDGCDFPISLLYDAFSRITPGEKVTAHGRAIFRREHHEWGNDREEIKNETTEEREISIVLELSKDSYEVALIVHRNTGIYESIVRKAPPPAITQRKRE